MDGHSGRPHRPVWSFDQYAKEYGLEVSDFAGNGKTDSSRKDGKDTKKHVKSEHKLKVSPEVPASIALLKARAAQACQMLNNNKIPSAQYLGEMKSIRVSVAGVAAKWPKRSNAPRKIIACARRDQTA